MPTDYQIMNRATINLKRREKDRSERRKAMRYFNTMCVRCANSDYRYLQFDHKNSDGCDETHPTKPGKKLTGRHLRQAVIDAMYEGNLMEKYQLLCANCNWIKRWENAEDGRETFYKTKTSRRIDVNPQIDLFEELPDEIREASWETDPGEKSPYAQAPRTSVHYREKDDPRTVGWSESLRARVG